MSARILYDKIYNRRMKRWRVDEIIKMFVVRLVAAARNRDEWKKAGEAFIQQWMVSDYRL